MKKLFMSFTTLLREIAEGHVTQEDLNTGFFLFGCQREHALDPGAKGETDERQWNKGKNAAGYPALRAALLEAEKDGRADWIRGPGRQPLDEYVLLNEMLARKGLPTFEHNDGDRSHRSYERMEDLLLGAGIPLAVVR